MNREAENTLLLLVGVATAMITVTGAFTRYVKASMLPWLVISAVVTIHCARAWKMAKRWPANVSAKRITPQTTDTLTKGSSR